MDLGLGIERNIRTYIVKVADKVDKTGHLRPPE